MEMIFLSIVVVAIVEFFRRLKEKDYYAAATILGAAIAGGIIGYFRIEGATVITGISAGLLASGMVKLGKSLGGR